VRLPDLFLYAHVLQVFDEDPDVEQVPPVIVGAVRTIASGALRLAHRALETHARNVGYETGAWVDRALEQAGASMKDVVRVTYILPHGTEFPKAWPALRRHFGEVRPAATMIAAGVADPRIRIEIEVTALKGATRGARG